MHKFFTAIFDSILFLLYTTAVFRIVLDILIIYYGDITPSPIGALIMLNFVPGFLIIKWFISIDYVIENIGKLLCISVYSAFGALFYSLLITIVRYILNNIFSQSQPIRRNARRPRRPRRVGNH